MEQTVSVEGFQIQTLLDHIGEQAKEHAREIMTLKTQQALKIQELTKKEEGTDDADQG